MNDARLMARTLPDFILQGALPTSCLAAQDPCNILPSIFSREVLAMYIVQ